MRRSSDADDGALGDEKVTWVCRFHRPGEDAGQTDPIILRKRKLRQSPPIHLIAADETTITDANGTRPIETFQDMLRQSYVTLTRREADIIALANAGSRPPVALEEAHTWLPRRSFVPVSSIGYEALVEIYRRYGAHLISAADYCDTKWNTICNSVRRKSPFDARFHSAWHLPIQNVFVLEERRADRCVVALDVNAMYSACMQERIPKPSALKRVMFDRDYTPGERLAAGLYRCRLSNPVTEFIKRHNPFTTFFCGRRLQASLSEPVNVDLNEFEISYYRRHFEHIYLYDAVTADEMMPHPLAREAVRAFARRLSYRSHGNKPLADQEKFLATLLSSCASRPKRLKRVFADRSEAMSYLASRYGIDPPTDEPEVATDTWMGRGRSVAMSVAPNGAKVDAPELDDTKSCFMLGQRIVAKGRVHLLELMESVIALGQDIHICYVNIDSIHFSAPRSQVDRITQSLAAKASNAMGAFKIEAVTSHGLWLEPGRYWLYSEKVEKFRNRSIGDKTLPFKDRAFHVASRRVGDLYVPIRALLRMDKSMSDARTLEADCQSQTGLVRQRLIERSSAATYPGTLDLLERNRSIATPQRLEAFLKLKELIEGSCPAASGQD